MEGGKRKLRLTDRVQNPETALSWLDYLSRFPNAPFYPPDTYPDLVGVHPWERNWMLLGTSELSWLDIWVVFCLARRVSLRRGSQGPWGDKEWLSQFQYSAKRFGVVWEHGQPPAGQSTIAEL